MPSGTLGISSRELVVVFLLVLLAAAVRLIDLGTVPPYLHADEAIPGLEAHRILREGWIGPYSREASGVPSGLFYWTAAIFAIAGESMQTIRLSFAVVGIATVALQYAAVRVWFDRNTAIIATALLAVLTWHVHFSRTAFIPIGTPFFVVLTVFCLGMAWRRRSYVWFALTGLALGCGLYTYQGYVGFVVAFVFCLACVGAVYRLRRPRELAAGVLVILTVALVVAIPLIRYTDANSDVVLGRYKRYSVLQTTEFRQKNELDRVTFLVNRGADFVRDAFARPALDPVDGSGHFRLVDIATTALIIVGTGIALTRIRSPVYLFLILITLLIGAGAVIATEGWHRRALAMVPFLTILAALPLSLGFEVLRQSRVDYRRYAWCAGGVAFLVIAGLNLRPYFASYRDNNDIRQVFGANFVPAMEAVQGLDDDVRVLLFSDRIAHNYPPLRFLAPSNPYEDRSDQFGKDGLDLTTDRSRETYFLFLGQYRGYAAVVQKLYPGGTLIEGPADQFGPTYLAYDLPAGSTATPPIETGTDARRRWDLAAIAQVLDDYRAREGAYPSTEGEVQTACAGNPDPLCRLRDLGIGSLQDRRGDPANYGYWYASDGKSFTLYASMAGSVAPSDSCTEPSLSFVANLYCLRSGE